MRSLSSPSLRHQTNSGSRLRPIYYEGCGILPTKQTLVPRPTCLGMYLSHAFPPPQEKRRRRKKNKWVRRYLRRRYSRIVHTRQQIHSLQTPSMRILLLRGVCCNFIRDKTVTPDMETRSRYAWRAHLLLVWAVTDTVYRFDQTNVI